MMYWNKAILFIYLKYLEVHFKSWFSVFLLHSHVGTVNYS